MLCVVFTLAATVSLPSCSVPNFGFVTENVSPDAGLLCLDGAQDGEETGVDCGGGCAPCPTGSVCSTPADCADKVCVAARCAAATCGDRVQNEDESDVDCGGTTCGSCVTGQHCVVPADCVGRGCNGGFCAPACGTGLADCNGDPADGCEVNLKTSGDHCGACGSICSLPHALASCVAAECAVASCSALFADCDGKAENGCETDLSADAQNCGACHAECPAVHGSATCVAGQCAIQCTEGFADCNDDRGDGCEKSLLVDALNCGACGKICEAVAGGTPWCKNGACGETICPAGRGDCNGDPSDGCETVLGTDPNNCNTCGNTCSAAQATTGCSGGACTIVKCQSGYADCANGYADGCEAHVDSDPANCGACGAACLVPNAAASCSGGACGISKCVAPFQDCDGLTKDGCEVDTSSSLLNCGGCGARGADCTSAFPNAGGHCKNSACTMDACHTVFADCDGEPFTGCETNRTTDPNHCGSCSTTCATANALSTSCTNGSCVPACASGHAACSNPASGCLTDETSDASNCGACGQICDAAASAHVTSNVCANSSCTPTCAPGFADCDGDPTNGCETNVKVDSANCGGCARPCATGQPAHVTANSCNGGQCQPSCSAGFADCDGRPENGCELSVSADSSNCGGCGVLCKTANATASMCASGKCNPSCSTGYGACGNPADGCATNLGTASNCKSCANACVGATPYCADVGCVRTTCTGPGEFPDTAKQRCYLFSASSKSFSDALATCQTWGGSLASITSSAEATFTASHLGLATWIGGTDQAVEFTFVWTSGEAWAYTNWNPGEPSDTGGNERCVEVLSGGNWNDTNCSSLLSYLCEKAMR